MEFFKSELANKIANVLFIFLIIILVLVVSNRFNLKRLLDTFEAKSFDIRQSMSFLEKKKTNDNLVVLTIDDNSLEILQEDYGRWPWKREIWADVTNYLMEKEVDALSYDLMFLGHQKEQRESDLKLVKALDSYENVYTSMNFKEIESAQEFQRMVADYKKGLLNLPSRLSVGVKSDDSSIDFMTFPKYRKIMDEIIDSNANIGFITVRREADGINRAVPLLIRYKHDKKLYPYLSFKMVMDYLAQKEKLDINSIKINDKNELVLGERRLKLDKTGNVYLNWYIDEKGVDTENRVFKSVPLWKVIKSIKLEEKGLEPLEEVKNLKGKTIFVGATAVSLYDIKSVPTARNMPGVYFHPTLFNNILDDNLISKTDHRADVLLVLWLSLLVALVVTKSQSPIVASTLSVLLSLGYIVSSVIAVKLYNLWMPLIIPIIMAILTFTIMYIFKYVKKSRDFEYTYKLATTDGLTNLYNHRYFQDQLVSNIELYQRYKNQFSIVLIDIDFFKKFNDTYGHQAGDAVLKQVAEKLKKLVRGTDIVARYGGEEMVIILTNTPIDEAYKAANKVCEGIGSTPFKLSADLEVNVTISVGVATYPMHGKTPSELIEVADKALYFAKENGRNQVGKIEGYESAK